MSKTPTKEAAPPPLANARQPAKKFSSHFLICARRFFSSKRKRKLFDWLPLLTERAAGLASFCIRSGMAEFPEVVAHAAEEFKLNLIANFLFDLAGRFNSFYAALPVIQAEGEVRAVRLKLVEAVAITIKNGLDLLGIEAPEEM